MPKMKLERLLSPRPTRIPPYGNTVVPKRGRTHLLSSLRLPPSDLDPLLFLLVLDLPRRLLHPPNPSRHTRTTGSNSTRSSRSRSRPSQRRIPLLQDRPPRPQRQSRVAREVDPPTSSMREMTSGESGSRGAMPRTRRGRRSDSPSWWEKSWCGACQSTRSRWSMTRSNAMRKR